MSRLVGINHVALEVGDLDEALAFYGRAFHFELRVQLVEYGRIQFAKTPALLAGMGLEDLEKTPEALEELRKKGLGG